MRNGIIAQECTLSPKCRHIMKWLVLLFLRLYKRIISPMLPAACRFYPTCSVYAIEAVEKYGAFRGGWLAMKRISKCHPFHPGGVDLVP
ncbi:MAG: membrane protein insertion efficiency factor YidD [Candidatus Kapabacteria bacterium]|nr:membrane protein insertion efficiency factor YidD [Candidatus Kapabacteria bacterium]